MDSLPLKRSWQRKRRSSYCKPSLHQLPNRGRRITALYVVDKRHRKDGVYSAQYIKIF